MTLVVNLVRTIPSANHDLYVFRNIQPLLFVVMCGANFVGSVFS